MTRSEKMREINALRSIETRAVIRLIKTLNSISNEDAPKYRKYYGLIHGQLFRENINSYRAAKIARKIGKTVNKQKLLQFANPNYSFITDSENFNKLIEINTDALNSMFIRLKEIEKKKG